MFANRVRSGQVMEGNAPNLAGTRALDNCVCVYYVPLSSSCDGVEDSLVLV